MRGGIPLVVVVSLAACNGTTGETLDAGTAEPWAAGYSSTDYPNNLRAWLKVLAPGVVERVTLGEAELQLEIADGGVWAQVPRSFQEGVTDLVVSGSLPDQNRRSSSAISTGYTQECVQMIQAAEPGTT